MFFLLDNFVTGNIAPVFFFFFYVQRLFCLNVSYPVGALETSRFSVFVVVFFINGNFRVLIHVRTSHNLILVVNRVLLEKTYSMNPPPTPQLCVKPVVGFSIGHFDTYKYVIYYGFIFIYHFFSFILSFIRFSTVSALVFFY